MYIMTIHLRCLLSVALCALWCQRILVRGFVAPPSSGLALQQQTARAITCYSSPSPAADPFRPAKPSTEPLIINILQKVLFQDAEPHGAAEAALTQR